MLGPPTKGGVLSWQRMVSPTVLACTVFQGLISSNVTASEASGEGEAADYEHAVCSGRGLSPSKSDLAAPRKRYGGKYLLRPGRVPTPEGAGRSGSWDYSGSTLRWYVLALVVSLFVGALSLRTGEAPTRIRPWALVLGVVLYVVLVLVTWARGKPVRRATG
jgi:hypothetical protein